MSILTLNDLSNEDAYTYAEMLALYKDKINEIIEALNAVDEELESKANKSMLTPELVGYATCDDSGYYTFSSNYPKGLYLLTYGYLFIILPMYNLETGRRYKATGPSIYDEDGSVRNLVYNYKYEDNEITIWSGNNDYPLMSGYTGYLFKIGLY